MIKELSIKNFRSIRDATLELGRFTVLTGANNSGKSSVLYALQVLKNIVTNPNQSLDSLLNLHFLNLGGIEETLFGKKKSLENLSIGITAEEKPNDVFRTSLLRTNLTWIHGSPFGEDVLEIHGFSPFKFAAGLGFTFPYALNRQMNIKIQNPEGLGEFQWNGIKIVESNESRSNFKLNEQADLPTRNISTIDVIPTSRGFTKPIFNTTPLNGHIYTEDEVATLLAIDKEVQSKVAFYFEKITGKRFSISIQPGMGFFYMQVREADGSFATELVNQGMGMNQIVFLLAKILYGKNRLICIDEPEIHLHPSLIEQFVRVLVEIAEKEDKQFIFSTHSEHWLLSLLAEVNDGKLSADDLKVFYLQKNDRETIVEQQQVMPNGQLEGGLKNFMESQMRLAERFFDTTTA
jgi:energy-coupling factor transporter ATP-binding protein EcfA2